MLFAVWQSQRRRLRREALYAQRLQQEVRDRTAELALRNAELERVNRRLRETSVTDPLTGLGNRRYLYEAMTAAGEATTPAPSAALLIIDLDHFKPINDVHGHEAGDQILVTVADILRRCCRASDLLVRWGGDEFVIAYLDADLTGAELLAERIRSMVAKHVFPLPNGETARTSCSIGFCRYPFVVEAPRMLSWEQTCSQSPTRRSTTRRWNATAGPAGRAPRPPRASCRSSMSSSATPTLWSEMGCSMFAASPGSGQRTPSIA